MTTRRTLLRSAIAVVTLLLGAPVVAQAKEPIPVVATFSILGDMVAQIGGKHVAVTTLVGPNGDAHVYQPTPADARSVGEAKLLFVNGLNFEGWIDRLVDASDFDGTRVVATAGIKPIAFGDEHDHDDDHSKDHGKDDHAHDHGKKHAEADRHDAHADHDHGAFDPHAWQSLANGQVYARNIAKALAAADPANAKSYQANAAAYAAKMQTLDNEIFALIEVMPMKARTVVTSHDAFGYFAARYGLIFEAPQGLSTESEASAADVAALIKQIRKDGISAVFVESITDNRLLEQIARETGATIGGTLYSDALSEPDGPASTYLDMMRHNATTLAKALSS